MVTNTVLDIWVEMQLPYQHICGTSEVKVDWKLTVPKILIEEKSQKDNGFVR